MLTPKPRPLADIAKAISAHLARFEADPTINKPDPTYKTKRYYSAHAWRTGVYVSIVYIVYISYQGADRLSRAEAEKYLAWLDAGNVGHWPRVRATR